MYLMSLGHPHNTGLQLGKACYPWGKQEKEGVFGEVGGGMFLLLLFLHFHSFSSFSPIPLFHLIYYLLSLFSLSLGVNTK